MHKKGLSVIFLQFLKVPAGMSKYLTAMDLETELTRKALLLYPYILNELSKDFGKVLHIKSAKNIMIYISYKKITDMV